MQQASILPRATLSLLSLGRGWLVSPQVHLAVYSVIQRYTNVLYLLQAAPHPQYDGARVSYHKGSSAHTI